LYPELLLELALMQGPALPLQVPLLLRPEEQMPVWLMQLLPDSL
jgi:hypothetical protein